MNKLEQEETIFISTILFIKKSFLQPIFRSINVEVDDKNI